VVQEPADEAGSFRRPVGEMLARRQLSREEEKEMDGEFVVLTSEEFEDKLRQGFGAFIDQSFCVPRKMKDKPERNFRKKSHGTPSRKKKGMLNLGVLNLIENRNLRKITLLNPITNRVRLQLPTTPICS